MYISIVYIFFYFILYCILLYLCREHGEIQDTQLIDILEKGRKEASSVANFIWKNMNRTLTKTATEENTDKVK